MNQVAIFQLSNVRNMERKGVLFQKQYITLLNNLLQNLASSISNGYFKPSSLLKSTENVHAIAQEEPQVFFNRKIPSLKNSPLTNKNTLQ